MIWRTSPRWPASISCPTVEYRAADGDYRSGVLSLIPHDMQYGPQAALIAEAFTPRLRYSGASLGYQLAAIIAGGPVSRELKFWVEVECKLQDLRKADNKEVATILREHERRGDAMRSLNRRGQVVWKATPQMLERLADAEAEADAEDRMRE
jgi:hypothetical protein